MRGEGRKTIARREAILSIMADPANEGTMSSRQVAYLCVGLGVIEGTEAEKESIGRLICKMRDDGSVPWERIVDRTRAKIQRPGWEGAAEILAAAAAQYRRNLWTDATTIPMIACEKQALEGVFEAACAEYGAGLWILRGFNSYSFAYEWAKEIRNLGAEGKHVHVYYFGDHDPPGLDIEADCINKLLGHGAGFSWERDGLNLDDFDKFDLVRVPVKMKYHGAKSFLSRFGDRSAELDALPPAELGRRIRTCIERHVDPHALAGLRREEDAGRDSVEVVAKNWNIALAAARGAA